MKNNIMKYVVLGILAAAVAVGSGCDLEGAQEYTIDDLVFRLGGEFGQVLEDGAVVEINSYSHPADEKTVYITVPGEGTSQTGLGRGIEYDFNTENYYNSGKIMDIISTQSGEIQEGNPNYITVKPTPFQDDSSTMIADGVYDSPLIFLDDDNEKIVKIIFRMEFNNGSFGDVVLNVPGDIHATTVEGRAYLFDGATSAKVAARFGDPLGGGTAWQDPAPLKAYVYPFSSSPKAMGGTPFIVYGDYYSLFYIDADENGALNAGEKGVFKSVTVAGDLMIEITADELSAAVTESFSMINGGALPPGDLVIRFTVPNGGEPDKEKDQVTYSLASWNSVSLTSVIDGPVIPGTYGIFAYIDEDSGYDLSGDTTDWDLVVGEFYLELDEVEITGGGVVLDGYQFHQLN